MVIPGLPGGFFSSTREIHLFPLEGRLCLRPNLQVHAEASVTAERRFRLSRAIEGLILVLDVADTAAPAAQNVPAILRLARAEGGRKELDSGFEGSLALYMVVVGTHFSPFLILL